MSLRIGLSFCWSNAGKYLGIILFDKSLMCILCIKCISDVSRLFKSIQLFGISIQISKMRKHYDNLQKKAQFVEEIRRKNREEIFHKKRTTSNNPQSDSLLHRKSQQIIDKRFQQHIASCQNISYSLEKLGELEKALYSQDILKNHYGIIGISRLLSSMKNPPIDLFIQTNIITKITQFASKHEFPQLQLQAAWCMANIASGSTLQCGVLINYGGIQILINLLSSEHIRIIEQAVWALGNIACDITQYRDRIVSNNGVSQLAGLLEFSCGLLHQNKDLQFLINFTAEALANLVRSKPLIPFNTVRVALEVFFKLINQRFIKQTKIIASICWAISYYISKKKETSNIDKIQMCIDSNIIKYFNELMGRKNDSLILACIAIMRSVASGTAKQCQYLLSMEILPVLEELLSHNKKGIRREVCGLLSYISANSIQCCYQIFSNTSLTKQLFNHLYTDHNQIKIQICYLLTNPISISPEAMYQLYKETDIIKYYTQILINETQIKMLETALDTLYLIMQLGQKFEKQEPYKQNFFVGCLLKEGLVRRLQDLQEHDDDTIYQGAAKILGSFFQLSDDFDF